MTPLLFFCGVENKSASPLASQSFKGDDDWPQLDENAGGEGDDAAEPAAKRQKVNGKDAKE